VAAEDEKEGKEKVSLEDEDEDEDEGEESAVTPEVVKRNVLPSVRLVSVFVGGILLLVGEATAEGPSLVTKTCRPPRRGRRRNRKPQHSKA